MVKDSLIFPKPRPGLCISCNGLDTCSYKKKPKEPIMFCEEFQPTPQPKEKKSRLLKSNRVSRKKPLSRMLSGLCRNCELLISCSLKKPPGGVWHCEEYS